MADSAAGVSGAAPTPQNGAPSDEPTLTLEAHDHQQLEVQFAHAFSGSDEDLTLELFFFIPRPVGITGVNYPRDEFYGDLTTYLRLDLPDVTLEELAGGRFQPIADLRAHLPELQRGGALSQHAAVEVKLFGHTFTEAVRDRFDELLAALKALPPAPHPRRWEYLDEVDRFAESARSALGGLRSAQHAFEPLGRAAPALLQTFRYTDEYSSLYLDGALALLAEAAREHGALFDGTGFVGRLRQTLARHARVEAEYRGAHGYLGFADAEGATREYFAYRQSFLKKAVQQALYVDTRRLVSSDSFIRNASAAVAAGLAATWALAAQLPTRIQSLPPVLQTALVALPVVAYMAKDRIKELTRDWLLSRVRAYDTRSEIALGSLADAGLASVSGSVEERVSFLELDAVPRDVIATRVADRTVRGAELGGESVMRYRRRLQLGSQKAIHLAPGMSLRQILRFNLRHFMTRLDEPEQRECHYSPVEDRFAMLRLPKVYHINLIARLEGPAQVQRRWRIVLNQEGIVRIEAVARRADSPRAAR